MRVRPLPAALAALASLAVVATGAHDAGCVPGQADPSTVRVIDLRPADDRVLYEEERDAMLPGIAHKPIPGSGAAWGDSTAVYEESNGLAGLQRGTVFFGHCDPVPQACPPIDRDPVLDEHCGHGPDNLVLRLER